MEKKTKKGKKQGNQSSTGIARKVAKVVEVDETRLAEAVTWINEKIRRNVHETYLEIGNYIFENFFGGDFEQVKSFNPYKESSFKRLSERTDLLMSKANLQRAVQVSIQEKKLLPTVSAMKRLTFTHKALLLPLKDDKKKEELANKVVEKNLTTRELQVLVAEARETEPRSAAGRPSLPDFQKNVKRAFTIFGKERALEGLDTANLNKEEAIELRDKIKHIIASVNQIEEVLNSIIESDDN